MSVFDDLEPELENGKKCFEYIYSKDVPQSAEAMTDWTSFNIDWYSEPMPLENKEGTGLEQEVRKMICEACYREDVPDLPKTPPPPEEEILIFADQGGLVQRILEKAPEGRVGPRKIVAKHPSAVTEQEIEQLISSKVWDMIIYGFPLDPPQSSSLKDVMDQQSAVVKTLFTILQVAFRKEGHVKRLAVLTHDIFSESEETHRERGLASVTNGTMYGMCNTARQEVEFPIQLIDTELTDCYELLPHLAAELFRLPTFGVNTVRHCYPSEIRNGVRTNRPAGRYVVRQVTTHKYQPAGVKFEIPEEGVIAISGGNGALGLVMGGWLLDYAEKLKVSSGGAYKPKFTIHFLSRSMKVSDLNMPMWRKIQDKSAELGVTVEQSKMDVSSKEGVESYVAKVTPNLIGIIHSAGVLQDSMIPNQTWEKFETVFSSKHWAALYLHDALERYENPNLKFFWMFSSTSVYGSMGQINYSTSNSALDALARHRVSLGKPACAMQWGAWGEVGMAATMDDVMRRRVMNGPVPYFTVKQGLEGLEGGLRTGLPGFSVFIVNPLIYFGMIHGDPNVTARYGRNFTSEFVPPPAPVSWDREQTYNIYRMYRYIMYPYADAEKLVYNKFIKPKVQAQEEEEEDDGIIELGYPYA